VAVQLTVEVVVTRKRATPESGHSKLRMPEVSVAVTFAWKDTRTSGRLSLEVVVYLYVDGQERDGAVVSTTVTLKVQEEESPELSTAVAVTVVFPYENW